MPVSNLLHLSLLLFFLSTNIKIPLTALTFLLLFSTATTLLFFEQLQPLISPLFFSQPPRPAFFLASSIRFQHQISPATLLHLPGTSQHLFHQCCLVPANTTSPPSSNLQSFFIPASHSSKHRPLFQSAVLAAVHHSKCHYPLWLAARANGEPPALLLPNQGGS